MSHSLNRAYLFLGSTKNNKEKFVDLKNGTINWINISELQQIKQTDMLLLSDFWDKVV